MQIIRTHCIAGLGHEYCDFGRDFLPWYKLTIAVSSSRISFMASSFSLSFRRLFFALRVSNSVIVSLLKRYNSRVNMRFWTSNTTVYKTLSKYDKQLINDMDDRTWMIRQHQFTLSWQRNTRNTSLKWDFVKYRLLVVKLKMERP